MEHSSQSPKLHASDGDSPEAYAPTLKDSTQDGATKHNGAREPGWERAAASLRHITTLVVSAIAAVTFAIGLTIVAPGEAEQAGSLTSEQSSESQADAGQQSQGSDTQRAADLEAAVASDGSLREGEVGSAQTGSIGTAGLLQDSLSTMQQTTLRDEVRAQELRLAQVANVSAIVHGESTPTTQGNIVVDAGAANATNATIDGEELAQSVGASQEFPIFMQAISDFEGHGYSLSITLLDLNTGRALRYRPDVYYYSASSIKGPFTISGYEEEVDAGLVDASVVDPITERVLVASDNDAYAQLRDIFGSEGFAEWLDSANVDPGAYETLSDLASIHYPHISTNQLATMWVHLYDYLTNGSSSAEKLVSYMRRREVSPIKDAVGDTYDTWSKAGWIDIYATGGVEPATWDAGVVFAPSGTYVVAIASNAPSDLSALSEVAEAVDGIHSALVR